MLVGFASRGEDVIFDVDPDGNPIPKDIEFDDGRLVAIEQQPGGTWDSREVKLTGGKLREIPSHFYSPTGKS